MNRIRQRNLPSDDVTSGCFFIDIEVLASGECLYNSECAMAPY